jgi:hypothetical protein
MKKAKRAAPTPRYQVSARAPDFDLPKNGSAMTLWVKDDNVTLGTLEIGRGSIRWWKNNAKDGHPTRTLTWAEFGALMNN